MKKAIITASILSLFVASSLMADVVENYKTCQELSGSMPSVAKAIVDAYSIEHHKEFQCSQITKEEIQKVASESSIYVFLMAYKTTQDQIGSGRVLKACSNLFYESMVDNAIKNKIDTIDGIKDSIANGSLAIELNKVMPACHTLSKSLGE